MSEQSPSEFPDWLPNRICKSRSPVSIASSAPSPTGWVMATDSAIGAGSATSAATSSAGASASPATSNRITSTGQASAASTMSSVHSLGFTPSTIAQVSSPTWKTSGTMFSQASQVIQPSSIQTFTTALMDTHHTSPTG